MTVIDIRNWLHEAKVDPALPRLKSKVKKIAEIIAYATSREVGVIVRTPPTCGHRLNGKSCKGTLEMHVMADERIYWVCPRCGDEGVIDGFRGLIWDMTAGTYHRASTVSKVTAAE
jgi:hypothetical protein